MTTDPQTTLLPVAPLDLHVASVDGFLFPIYPYAWGGRGRRFDGKELVARSTLCLPAAISPGLSRPVVAGAVHDGEAWVMVIVYSMERVDLAFDLCTSLRLTTPRACTPVRWLIFGFRENLDEAVLVP